MGDSYGNSFLISIHAPRVGSDIADPFQYVNGIQFQSTLPVWGATAQFLVV